MTKGLLLALAGAGNEILRNIVENAAFDDLMVVSRRENGDFPYYECRGLPEECAEFNIPCHEIGYDKRLLLDLATGYMPDFIITATFHLILEPGILRQAKWAINMHPSLLPHYRGATPTHWTVANGEKTSGITWHMLSEKIDSGNMIERIETDVRGLTDGEVRKKLYGIAGQSVRAVIDGVRSGSMPRLPHAGGQGSWQPRFMSPQGIALIRESDFSQEQMRLAVAPYPGESFLRFLRI